MQGAGAASPADADETTVLSHRELVELGFAELGQNVRIDRRVAVFKPSRIRIGSHVRIDAFTVIAGGAEELRIGSYVHIAAACYLSPGDGGISVGNFCTLAPRVSVHGHSDDYRHGMLTGGIVPAELTGGVSGRVTLSDHVIVGSGSVLLPGVIIGLGAAVGAMTLVRRPVDAGAVVAGNPCRVVGQRDDARLAELEAVARRLMP